MIYRKLYIPQYDWLVHVFYHVSCYWVDEIMDCLKSIGCPPKKRQLSYNNIVSCKLDTGLTYSNYKKKKSVMVISKTSSPQEFANSVSHEGRHLEDHIAIAYDMEMGGEEIAYLAGYLGKKLSKDMQMFICTCHCHQKDIKEKAHKHR